MVPVERETMVEKLRASAARCVEQALARANTVVPVTSRIYEGQSRKAVEALYDHVVDGFESRQRPTVAIPIPVLAQARLAAVSDLTLDSLLRRFMAVNSQITVHVTEMVGQVGLSEEGWVDMVRIQVRVFEQVIESVIEEYGRATPSSGSTAKARLKLVKGILGGRADRCK